MKTKLITTFLLLLLFHLSPSTAQDKRQFGIRASIGVFGYPTGYELEDSIFRRKDGYYRTPNIAFAAGMLMEYTFFRKGNVSMAIQTEFGFNYTSSEKRWTFKRNYDINFENHTVEQEIIHELKALYITFPIRGSLQYKKWRGTMGVCPSRVFFATGDRNFRTRSGMPLAIEWTETKDHWRSTKVRKGAVENYAPYINDYFAFQGILALEYQVTKNIFIGLEARRFYLAPNLRVYSDSEIVRSFGFDGEMLTLSFLYVN